MTQFVDERKALECKYNMASEQEYDNLSVLFHMFSDSTRLKIMSCLFTHELCVSDLAMILDMSHSAVSHQLQELKKTKLVVSRRVGKLVFYSMADDHVSNIYKMAYDHINENK